MAHKKTAGYASLLAFAMLVLILDSRTGLDGCQAGVALCISNVIPALFPFLVLSPVFIQALGQRGFKPAERLLRLPPGTFSLLITGCLGGYPVGAQCIVQAAQAGHIRKEDARRMLGFCCNCGPSFLFGICSGFFTSPGAPWTLWAIHIFSAVLVGAFLPGGGHAGSLPKNKPLGLSQALPAAVKTMGSICGWVVLFRCLLEFLTKWVFWRLPLAAQVIFGGTLELTNGCFRLGSISSEGLRFVICEGMLTFGGLCVTMQTANVTREIGLGMYLPGKLLQTVISVLLAGAYVAANNQIWSIFIASGLLLGASVAGGIFFLRKREKYSRNLRPVGV